MFDSLGWGEIMMLLVIALFVLGPERLPEAARELGKILRGARRMFDQLTAEVREELGPELGNMELSDLHPRSFIQKHLIDPEEADEPDPSIWEEQSSIPERYRDLEAQHTAERGPDTESPVVEGIAPVAAASEGSVSLDKPEPGTDAAHSPAPLDPEAT